MNKTLAITTIALVAVVMGMSAVAPMIPQAEAITPVLPSYDSFAEKIDKEKTTKLSVEKLKEPKAVKLKDGRIVEKTIHIFYKEGFVPSDENVEDSSKDKAKGDKGPKKDKPAKPGNSCFDYLAKKPTMWKISEPYFVNTDNNDGLSQGFIAGKISTSVTTWETASGVTSEIFGQGFVSNSAQYVDGMDGNNVVIFASIDDPNVIAVTITWGIFSGSDSQRQLVEWDMIFNDAAFTFDDAGPTNEKNLGNTSVMDLENIATHEFGHAAGLGHPRNTCTNETMFASAAFGETKKRTLNAGDVIGIDSLY